MDFQGPQDVVLQAQRLRLASADKRLRLRRPFTVTESYVVALIGRGLNYPQIAQLLRVSWQTANSHCRSAAEKVLDGPSHDVLAAIPSPKLRVFEWVRAVEGRQIVQAVAVFNSANPTPEDAMT